VKTDHPSYTRDHPGIDRRVFRHKVLCDARAEFSQLDAPSKIIEAGLLTTMGALGLTNGLACLSQAEAGEVRITNKSVDEATAVYVQNHFCELQDRCSASDPRPDATFETCVHLFNDTDPMGHPLNTSGLNLLVHWRMGKEMAGLMLLGHKIVGLAFENEEIDFVRNVIDHMVMALQAVTARAVIRTLENELQQAREQIREGTLRNEAAKKELERTLFRLSGFNDIFQELSGLHESPRVIESFLLVLIGIFSAKSGAILYADAAAGKTYIAGRGVDSSSFTHGTSEQIRSRIASVFAAPWASALAPMQAEILPAEHLAGSSSQMAREGLVIVFKVDEADQGLLCLGQRLVEARYGRGERELLLAFTHNFLVFLKNSKSFEIIEKLHAEQEQKNIALQQTIQALSASKRTILSLETAGERIRNLITRATARSSRVSLVDICVVLLAGVILGLVYNYASPGGIAVIPVTWRHPASPRVEILKATRLFNDQAALFVDARPPEFYNQQHIKAAVNLPPALFDFIYMMRFNRLDPEQTLVVYGRTVSRRYDEEIAYRLRERGHAKVMVLPDGIGPWKAKGLPTEP
jgi:rhodanese-related sulfurtransferase